MSENIDGELFDANHDDDEYVAFDSVEATKV